MRGRKYVWDKRTDSELQLWPSSSYERYLTRPFVSPTLANKSKGRENFISPAEPFTDFFSRFDITSSAITEHKGGYYQSRSGADFNLLIYTVGGAAILNIDGKRIRMGKGTVFLSPSGVSYEVTSCENGWRVFWFHLSGQHWDNLAGSLPLIYKSAESLKIFELVKIYAEEVYSSSQSPSILDNCSSLIVQLLSRDIISGKGILVKNRFDALFKNLSFRLSESITALSAARECGASICELNAESMRRYSKTFSNLLRDMRMCAAAIDVKRGDKFSDIAGRFNYADAYTFSKAFKLHFGVSPKAIRGK